MRNAKPPSKPENSVNYDPKRFWPNHYRSMADRPLDDWATIASITDPETRFHYNAIENSIIRALTLYRPIHQESPEIWRFKQRRRSWRILDVGSGAGHWIDFYLAVYFPEAVVGLDIAPTVVERLRTKYQMQPVTILEHDVTGSPPPIEPVTIVNAIGMMFHIVDDIHWRKSLQHLAQVLRPDGLILVGGDFGWTTYDAQFHAVDEFADWRDQSGERKRVAKRCRALAERHSAAHDAGW
jgi:SAM-dependent methyltransferase